MTGTGAGTGSGSLSFFLQEMAKVAMVETINKALISFFSCLKFLKVLNNYLLIFSHKLWTHIVYVEKVITIIGLICNKSWICVV